MDVRAGATSARVVQRLALTLFSPDWQKVPLGAAGSFIAADLGGLEGRVAADGEAWTLQVRGSGRHEVRLESVVPLARDETATRPLWHLQLRTPAAAVVRGRIAAPGTVEEVELGTSGLARRGADGAWSFVARPGQPLDLTLAGRRTLPVKARLPLRFEVTSATAATLTRTRFGVRSWIEARVAQGRLPELRVPLPHGPEEALEVVSVDGPVAGWNVDGGDLVITPLEPVESSIAVEIALTGEPRDTFTSPLLAPRGGARTLLFAKAALEGDGLLEVADRGKARKPEAPELAALPAAFRDNGGRTLAVTDPARPPRWHAVWAEGTEVLAVQVDRLLVDVAVGESGQASYQLWAEVRNRGDQQLSLTFPTGFELAAGERDGLPVTAGLAVSGTGASGAFAVPLRAADGAQIVHLAGILPLALPAGDGVLELPLPELSAPAARVEVRAVLPGGRSYELADHTRTGGVGSPPAPPSAPAVPASFVTQQLLASRAPSPAAPAGLFPRPPGFAELTAAWSALSATPGALAVHVDAQKERTTWF